MLLKLPKLGYSYNALEPYIDEETMIIHHTKHHNTYVNNSNEILKNINSFEISENDIIMNLKKYPVNIRTVLRNNLGGHINHSFFWKQLKIGESFLSKEFEIAVNRFFGSLENFKIEFTKLALSKFGSGWIWLVLEKNILSIKTTSNQDNPLMGKSISGVSGIPILGLDLWEHAYYLKYKNNRAEYINSFWKIINWSYISKVFLNII